MDDQTDDDLTSSPRAIGCMIALVLAPITLAFRYFGAPTRGYLVMALLAAYIVLLYLRRPIRAQSTTFACFSVLLMLQLVVALVVPLPDWPFSKGLLWLMALPALVLNAALLFVAEKRYGGLRAARGADD